MFTGCGTALVTPFKPDLSLDEAATRRLIQRQIREGIDFLVPCGTTGESPTLTREEHLHVVLIAVEEARKAGRKVPVLAGCGGYNTAEVIELAKELQLLGVDGLLSVTPYYNKVTQEGLYRHYKAIADAVPLPIVVYNVPGRTGVNVETATLKRLVGDREYLRSEGSLGQHQPDRGSVPQPPRYLRHIIRRRYHHHPAVRVGRTRSDFGGLEPDSRRDDQACAARRSRRFRRCACDTAPMVRR